MDATSLRKAVHPSGVHLHFDPASHTYLCGDEPFRSVTTIIKNFFPQFDAAAVAARKAEREGTTAADLMAMWEKKRDVASAFGSKIHLMAETLLTDLTREAAADHLATEKREKAFLASLKKAITRIGKYYEFIEAEKIVFSPQKKIAGTIDLLLRNKENGAYVVADWKTSREIKLNGYGDEKGTGPCFQLPNCNHVHYSMQLYAYRELLLSEGYLPAQSEVRGILIHLKDGGPEVVCDFIQPRILHAEVRAVFDALEEG